MKKRRERCHYAGCEIMTRPDVGNDPFSGRDLSSQRFIVEDWWENVYGRSWMVSDGNPAALSYAFRTGMKRGPTDNDVVYGKIDGLGYLLHVSELCLQEVHNESD